MEDIQVFTMLGHKEYDEEVTSLTVARYAKLGVVDNATLDDAERRNHWRLDGELIGRAMWGFWVFRE